MEEGGLRFILRYVLAEVVALVPVVLLTAVLLQFSAGYSSLMAALPLWAELVVKGCIALVFLAVWLIGEYISGVLL